MDIDSHWPVVSLDEVVRRLPPNLESELFSRLRRRYDQVIDDRLLGDRTSRPIIQPQASPQTSVDESADFAPTERLSWQAFEGGVDAEMQRLLATARYSLRLAANEGEKTHHLQRSTRSLAEAADWYAMLAAERRSVLEKTLDELQLLCRRLDELIDRRL